MVPVLLALVLVAYLLVNGWMNLMDWLDRRYATVADYERHKAAKRARRADRQRRNAQ